MVCTLLCSSLSNITRSEGTGGLQGHDLYRVVASACLRHVSGAWRVTEGVRDLGRIGRLRAAEAPVVIVHCWCVLAHLRYNKRGRSTATV